MPTAHSGGVRLHYDVTEPAGAAGGAEAPTVLLVMGLGMNGRLWGASVRHLARSGYRVVAPDNRGSGRSETPHRPWSIATMADDLAAVLDDAGVTGRAHVHGVSMGGMIAQEFVLRHPDRVGALVLGATTPGLPAVTPPPVATLAALVGIGVQSARGQGPADREAALRGFFMFVCSREFARRVDLSGPLATTVATALEDAATPRGYFVQLAAAVRHAAWRRLPQIAAPTLVQHGTADRIVPVRAGRIIAHRIAGAELQLLDGAGHAYALERPEDAIGGLVRFLDAHADALAGPRARAANAASRVQAA